MLESPDIEYIIQNAECATSNCLYSHLYNFIHMHNTSNSTLYTHVPILQHT